MANSTTFERIQAPAAPDAPEPHTPGPFVRHGVMVRDTVETTGGMFCIRPVLKPASGRKLAAHGDCIAYAYTRADADLMAAAPAMLAALKAFAEPGQPVSAHVIEMARAAIRAAEGRA